jgi:hypothetical protein
MPGTCLWFKHFSRMKNSMIGRQRTLRRRARTHRPKVLRRPAHSKSQYIYTLFEGRQQPGHTQSHCRWLHWLHPPPRGGDSLYTHGVTADDSTGYIPPRGGDGLDKHRVTADDSTGYNFKRGDDNLDTHRVTADDSTGMATLSRGEATASTHKRHCRWLHWLHPPEFATMEDSAMVDPTNLPPQVA